MTTADQADEEAIFDCRPNLLVGDLRASIDFYCGVLGFRLGWYWSDRRGQFLSGGELGEYGEPGTALVHRDRAQLILTQKAGGHGTWVHLDVRTAHQVDQLFQEWTGNGAAVAEPPVLRAWGMYEMRLHDPDGHVLRVSSPPADR